MRLWQERNGQFSALRATMLAILLLPAADMLVDIGFGQLGARPINELTHRTGLWAIRFLLLSLAVTPLRRLAQWPRLITVRRMIGVGAFCYALAHLLIYIGDQSFDLAKVVSEIARRLYLTIGFAALLGLTALAATSTDGMIKRLGGKSWRRLHQATYPIAVLAMVHYFMQSKLNVFEPTVVGGLLLWLFLYRALHAFRGGQHALPVGLLLAVTLVTTLLVFGGEALGYSFWLHIPPLRVLAADLMQPLRPGWYVLIGGTALSLLALRRRSAPAR